jgi:hypothetical protein
LSHKERAALIAASVATGAKKAAARKAADTAPKPRKSAAQKPVTASSEQPPKVTYKTRSYGPTGEGFRRTKLPKRPRSPIK